MADHPEINIEISVEQRLVDLVAERYDAGIGSANSRKGHGRGSDRSAAPHGRGRLGRVSGAARTSADTA